MLNATLKYSQQEFDNSVMDKKFVSRRSEVRGTEGICSSSQPLASAAGAKILAAGGTAADAAVAMAAALNVAEPCSTGIGGDAFALYYSAATKRVTCFMGNGCASRNISLEQLKENGLSSLPPRSGLCITVPGAAALWEDLVAAHGVLPLPAVLAPAIRMAERGVPIGPVTAHCWSRGFLQGNEAADVFLPAPQAGELFRNPKLAATFTSLATHGAKAGFYGGRIADAIVAAAREFGGHLDLVDLAEHRTRVVEPLRAMYRNHAVYQVPPPTHGVAVLVALRLLERLVPDTSALAPESRSDDRQVHVAVEAVRAGLADALGHIGDTDDIATVTATLLSDTYIAERAKAVDLEVTSPVTCGDVRPFLESDTVYFSCIDKDGNACSMINSNYMGFGTGISPSGCGFTLHNRGHNFSLTPGHPNALGPGKRPYHTIIPGLITIPQSPPGGQADCGTASEALFGVFGNMGGFMQPMGHVQLLRNLIDFKMSPQAAVDAPRWYLDGAGDSQSAADVLTSRLRLEAGLGGLGDGGADDGTLMAQQLRQRGHLICQEGVDGYDRLVFGKAQIITYDHATGVSTAGSDPRSDGSAVPCVM